jgi:hypothetical protein
MSKVDMWICKKDRKREESVRQRRGQTKSVNKGGRAREQDTRTQKKKREKRVKKERKRKRYQSLQSLNFHPDFLLTTKLTPSLGTE